MTKYEIEDMLQHHYFGQWENDHSLTVKDLSLLESFNMSLEEIIEECLLELLDYSKSRFHFCYYDKENDRFTQLSSANFTKIGHLLSRSTKSKRNFNFNDYDDHYDMLLSYIISDLVYKIDNWDKQKLLAHAVNHGENISSWQDDDVLEYLRSHILDTHLVYHIGSLPYEKLSCYWA